MLESWIRERIREQGPVPFATFMEWALYHPEWGYYTGERRKFGKEGDFFTSPGVNPVFAEVIADEIAAKWRALGYGSFTVLEFGAGDGRLARDILNRWAQQAPELYAVIAYRITETSPSLRALQRETLGEHVEKVTWLSEAELQAGAPYVGVILTNELVDAYPVHRIIGHRASTGHDDPLAAFMPDEDAEDEAGSHHRQDAFMRDADVDDALTSRDRQAASIRDEEAANRDQQEALVHDEAGSRLVSDVAELYVTWDEQRHCFAETEGPLSDRRIADYVQNYCPKLGRGQIAEVGLAGLDWYERALSLLQQGWIITIDYGFDAEMLHHPSRRTGTLRGFHRHTLTTDPYQHIGEQDLTADVNFTALRDIGEAQGWQTDFYGSQSRYLLQSGILERLTDTLGRDPFSDPDQKRNRAIRQMVLPGGMGDHFKVLVQHRASML